ncbi:Hypothetical predicted protein, partial [Pelobates cultripes]
FTSWNTMLKLNHQDQNDPVERSLQRLEEIFKFWGAKLEARAAASQLQKVKVRE